MKRRHMTEPDLLIKNARIVDGTGASEYMGNVAITDGLISYIGDQASPLAKKEINAKGSILTPGFIDIHTHFDPQLCWDGLATPSLEHGVTTVFIGNCSLSLAPVKGEGNNKIISMFEVIEDIKKPIIQEFDFSNLWNIKKNSKKLVSFLALRRKLN